MGKLVGTRRKDTDGCLETVPWCVASEGSRPRHKAGSQQPLSTQTPLVLGFVLGTA